MTATAVQGTVLDERELEGLSFEELLESTSTGQGPLPRLVAVLAPNYGCGSVPRMRPAGRAIKSGPEDRLRHPDDV